MVRNMNEDRPRNGATAAAALDRLVNQYPGPALIVGPGGRVVEANEAGRPLAAMIRAGHDGLARLVDRGRLSAQGFIEEVVFEQRGEGERMFEVTALPMGATVLLLARDITVERQLITNLADTRQRLTDIVGCLTDLSWETDSRGVLRFVAPRQSLGYTADELRGRDAAILLDPEWAAGRTNPFQGDHSLSGSEVWLKAKDGTRIYALLSCVPVRDDHDRFIGLRGVARDISATRAREATLTQALEREQLRGLVISAMRDQGGTDKALRVAAEASLSTLNGTGAMIVGRDLKGGIVDVLTVGQIALSTAQTVRAEVERLIAGKADLGPTTLQTGNDIALIAIAAEGSVAVGALALVRPSRLPWPPERATLLGAVADQLGLVLSLRERVSQLEALSRIDPLTGVMNRRAFDEELSVKLRQADRGQRRGTLLLIDFDGFKLLNDRFGHASGDRALSLFGNAVRTQLRAGDLVARIGGDEFALWLDGTMASGAFAKTDALYATLEQVKSGLGNADSGLGLSIGVAVYDPGRGEEKEELIARADKALYRAKRGGRNRAELAGVAGGM